MGPEEVEEMLHLPEYPHVIRMDVRTGETWLDQMNLGRVVSWLADREGVVRVASEVDCELRTIVHFRRDDQARWQPLTGFDLGDAFFNQSANGMALVHVLALGDLDAHDIVAFRGFTINRKAGGVGAAMLQCLKHGGHFRTNARTFAFMYKSSYSTHRYYSL